ncbi:hypothetical protein D3C77_820020 [compost metagenome]
MRKVVLWVTMPGVTFIAWLMSVSCWSSISWRVTVDTDCGVWRKLVGVLEPTLIRPGA